MRTRSLETLRRDAATTCKWRGHSMRWSKPFEYRSGRVSENEYVTGYAQDGVCNTCAMEARVMTRPAPNECEISGNALALTCDDTIYVRETLENEDSGYVFSDSDAQRCFTHDIGELFRNCQKEYGRCTSFLYQERLDGSTAKVGWTFEKLCDLDDHGSYPRTKRETQYKQVAWIHLYRKHDGETRFSSLELK